MISFIRSETLIRPLIFISGALSITSLLLYFLGFMDFKSGASWLLAIECINVSVLWFAAKKYNKDWICKLLLSGLWAGGLATLAYDVVRIPIAQAGIPVFKAISYFGTALLGVESPTPLSETLGWAYHLSNGISFGLMYAALVRKPHPFSAVIWGLTLEAVMLITPYAEVFGYRRDYTFLAITIGAHAVYGLVLWLALRMWIDAPKNRFRTRHIALGFLCVPLGLYMMAADFHGRYADRLPPSPPPYIGVHLYTTWDVPEPDRVAAMWVMRRFVEPQAKFYFIQPFEKIRYGKPFDLPEAEIRRHGIQSATEVLLNQQGLASDAKLSALARMTHLTEVTPWMLASDSEAGQLAEMVRNASEQTCGKALQGSCTEELFVFLDRWYQGR